MNIVLSARWWIIFLWILGTSPNCTRTGASAREQWLFNYFRGFEFLMVNVEFPGSCLCFRGYNLKFKEFFNFWLQIHIIAKYVGSLKLHRIYWFVVVQAFFVHTCFLYVFFVQERQWTIHYVEKTILIFLVQALYIRNKEVE